MWISVDQKNTQETSATAPNKYVLTEDIFIQLPYLLLTHSSFQKLDLLVHKLDHSIIIRKDTEVVLELLICTSFCLTL